MTCVGGRKLELVCILCNDSLADLEKACAGLLENNENGTAEEGGGVDSATVVSEPNSTLPDIAAGFGPGGPCINLPHHFGDYMPLSDRNHKQVVATKCGHLFHQGCLRKHIHKTLTEGKGGSLFCPICTRPFAMNRLWPVIIPPTKAQQDRYLQLQTMKNQNAQMVKHLKEVRAKIVEEEEHLKRIKENSEQCLNDIQQKQSLLDSVNGPTSKEMAELTKVHMKRQEILHVVTQHNADLLKLLALESNISTAIAENMISATANSQIDQVDANQNYLSARYSGGGKHPAVGNEYSSRHQPATAKKDSRKAKKEKSRKKSKKKNRRRHHHESSTSRSKDKIDKGRRGEKEEVTTGTGEARGYSLRTSGQGGGGGCTYQPVVMPSAMIPDGNNNNTTNPYLNENNLAINSQCRKVDTFTKWKIESMKELMYLPGVSDLNASHPSSTVSRGQDRNYPILPRSHHQHDTSQKNSVNIILLRKPNMLEKDGVGGISKKNKLYFKLSWFKSLIFLKMTFGCMKNTK